MTADLILRPVTVFVDPDRRPSGETPLPPPQNAPTGVVVPFPGTSAPQASAPATPAREARKAPKPKPRKYRLKDAIKADMTLPLRARIIGADLAELCDISEECAYPSHATLMKRNGMKLDTVKRALHDLDVEGEGAGYFAREVCAGPTGQNRYRPQWRKIGLDSAASDASQAFEGECSSALGGSAALPQGGSAVVHPIREGEYQKKEQVREAAQAPARSRGPAFERETTSAAEPVKAALPVKTSLPADWTPDDDTRRQCATLLSTADLASSLRRFRSHFAVENPERRFRDWGEQFRTWVERDAAKAARTASAAPKRRNPNDPMM